MFKVLCFTMCGGFYCYMCQVFKLKLVNIWQSVTCSGAIVAVTW